MKLTKTVIWGSLVICVFALGAIIAAQQATAMGKKSETSASKTTALKTYDATFYVAGMGGHFAVAETHIDPSSDTPITISNLTKLDIGDGTSHPTHDSRIDAKDRNVMFWSTYKLDPDADNKTHVGKINLATGDVLMDVTVAPPKGALNTKKNYCASGQTKDYYFPVAMTKPGYISVIRKKDMKVMHQVFVEGTDADPGVPYKYMHGITSPDMKEMFITMNEGDTPGKEYGKTIGKMHMVVLDTAALEKGKVKVLRKGIADGNKGSTISFRQYYSPDGKYIANATGDILFLIDAKTLTIIDSETLASTGTDQLHDAIFTPDSKYVVTTIRNKRALEGCEDETKPKAGEFLMDGKLMLYDVEAKQFIGKSTSTCLRCHDDEIGTGEDAVNAILCGLDGNWK